MCNGDDLILNQLFNFEPMEGLEHWGDVRMFGSASNSMCKFIFILLKALNLNDKGSYSIRGVNGRGQWRLWLRWWNRECVGCGEYREYGNDRRWRGMKSVWRKTMSSQINEAEIFGRQAGHYGSGEQRKEISRKVWSRLAQLVLRSYESIFHEMR